MKTDILIIGSGVAATTIARSLLNKGAKDILMVEAGGSVPMADHRRWQDYVMKGVGIQENRPYAECVDEKGDNASYENAGGGHESKYQSAPWNFPNHNWHISGSRLIVRGGTTLHWGGWAPRLMPEDFKLKTNTGIGLDWQFDYDDLEPYYSEAECLLQVMGMDNDPNQPDRPTGVYPYKPIPYSKTDGPLIELFERKGIKYGPLPISRNTLRNNECKLGLKDDPASFTVNPCRATGTCKYCPFEAKFTNDQSLDYILKHYPDNIRLLMQIPTKEIIFSGNTATGVKCVDKTSNKEVTINADHVIVAAGAFESPKILLASGLNNKNIGAHLTSHPMFMVSGEKIHNDIAPQQELHFPILCSRHFDSERYQRQGKALLVKHYEKPSHDIAKMMGEGKTRAEIDNEVKKEEYEIRGFIENVKGANTRVGIAKGRDKWGLPRTKLDISGDTYPEEAMKYYLKHMRRWLEEMGYSFSRFTVYPPAGHHGMSTCRMASNKNEGVVDKELKVFGTKNVYVVSNAVFPSGGVANPTLTLGAVSLKFASEFSSQYL